MLINDKTDCHVRNLKGTVESIYLILKTSLITHMLLNCTGVCNTMSGLKIATTSNMYMDYLLQAKYLFYSSIHCCVCFSFVFHYTFFLSSWRNDCLLWEAKMKIKVWFKWVCFHQLLARRKGRRYEAALDIWTLMYHWVWRKSFRREQE